RQQARLVVAGLESPLKIQRYEPGDFHGWHVDLGAPGPRGARWDYAGGELRSFDPPDPRAAPQQLGCAIGFPSYLPHELAEVTRGTRYALTAWAVGPPFR
ncbi:MAG: 2OG-Fe(II) oxygenase, partial [Myxococcales bacterium]|nr:2OG-Fe(II) oxygenase [Myxococcales bacterium]